MTGHQRRIYILVYSDTRPLHSLGNCIVSSSAVIKDLRGICIAHSALRWRRFLPFVTGAMRWRCLEKALTSSTANLAVNGRISVLTHVRASQLHIPSSFIKQSFYFASTKASQRWRERQQQDAYTKTARLQGLKSRAAFKLLEIDQKYKIFKPGQIVVDLGYAPGSWSQVAANRTLPGGRVLGIDIIPAQPPKGVSTIQGNFLSPSVQDHVRDYVRSLGDEISTSSIPANQGDGEKTIDDSHTRKSSATAMASSPALESDRSVDIVLSDMSAPWEQSLRSSAWSLINPYYRMMNTSGNSGRDHLGSMELCDAALRFAFMTLKPGGFFVCKFYQGSDEKRLESQLKILFIKVQRSKPNSSRNDSREAYFIGLKRKADVAFESIWT